MKHVVNSKLNQISLKQERQIMYLAQIMNTFYHEEGSVVFKLWECLYEEILTMNSFIDEQVIQEIDKNDAINAL